MICLLPLLVLATINFWVAVNAAQSQQKKNLQTHLALFTASVNRFLEDDGKEILSLAESAPLKTFVSANKHISNVLSDRRSSDSDDVPTDLKLTLSSVLNAPKHIERLVCFRANKQPLFLAERSTASKGSEAVRINTSNLTGGLPQPDERVWTLNKPSLLESGLTTAPFGATQVYTAPVLAEDRAESPAAALVAQINVDSILAEAAAAIERTNDNRFDPTVIVLSQSGVVLYHPNDSVKHQPVATVLPTFAKTAQTMVATREGTTNFKMPDGQDEFAVFTALPRTQVIAAVAMSSAQATAAAERIGWIGVLLSFLIAVVPAVVLTRYWERQNRGISKVTQGVTAIAKGELDHRIDVRSGDEAKVIAENINLMTERLREQLAREAEARQFESFVRLSAMLTHDLKNAIEALSLIVGNMEVHFHNERFRADAMKSLTLATEKLKGLVARITNPVTTLSGEHRRPVPTDITALLRRVAGVITEPVRGKYDIDINLAAPVYALVDAERMEKVIENLVINGIEAMNEKGSGKLTITAGAENSRRVFFTVTDTGRGMSAQFIELRLFRPFATTKKSGVGLGLYTCREVVRANGGSIQVQSDEGIGTTFRIVLPSAAI